jgi:molybdopterin-synthase adenylyltransferase
MQVAGRYSRQVLFSKIGPGGQERLGKARVAVVGLGALGSVVSDSLARAGVGFLRLIDRDYVERSNLQRQVLYDEEDARQGLPKAAAAAARIGRVNSEIKVEATAAHLDSGNVEALLGDVDLVLDGTDNFEARFLINEACLSRGIPWIYAGAVMDYGMTMNVFPGGRPCLRCLCPEMPAPGSLPTCATAGVLAPIAGIIANVEAAEAIKILVGSPDARRTLLAFDAWKASAQYLEIPANPECPACAQGRYEYLGKARGTLAASLCGRDEFQVLPAAAAEIDLDALARRLAPLGAVSLNRFMLGFAGAGIEIRFFRDGRAIVKGARDEAAARSIYSEYLGH